MDPKPRRPWWKKKRWAAALALWLAVAYFVAYGAGADCVGRSWIPPGDHLAYRVFAPIGYAAHLLDWEERNADFVGWCLRLGDSHHDPETPSIFPPSAVAGGLSPQRGPSATPTRASETAH